MNHSKQIYVAPLLAMWTLCNGLSAGNSYHIQLTDVISQDIRW